MSRSSGVLAAMKAVPYYSDDLVTLYLGDCREVTEWLTADVLVTDPPYGRAWRQGGYSHGANRGSRDGIAGDLGTSVRDAALDQWAGKPAIVFGDLMLAPSPGNRQTLVYRKPGNAGFFGSLNGYRRDVEAIYLLGPWPTTMPVRASSVITTSTKAIWSLTGGPHGHPHAKPVDVMEDLIRACPPGIIADPFAGAGSTLVAARNLGRQAIGVEISEEYAEKAVRRLSQGVLIETP